MGVIGIILELLEIKGGPVYFSNSTITAVG
jgi:hypothetical protein